MGRIKNRYKFLLAFIVFAYLVIYIVVDCYRVDLTIKRSVRTFTTTDVDFEAPASTTDVGWATLPPEVSETTEELASAVFEDEIFPFMTAVLHINKTLLGAGAIVGEKWILVTAFQMGAFKADQLTVRVGSRSPHSGGQLLNVDQLFTHPMFREFNNDVALLKTAEPVLLSESVQMIPLATSPPEFGVPAALIVWDNDTLVKNNADVLPVSECRMFYPDFELTESNICVVMDHMLPYVVTLYGSPLVFNGSLVGLYMGWEPATFKPSLCSSLATVAGWVDLMMTNENDTQRLFPLT